MNVLPKGRDKLLYESLLQESKQRYEEREGDVRAALKSPEAVGCRQTRLLSDYRGIIGELPKEKTPLNADITGVIECDG
jgi:hypothetical protein